MDAPARHLPPGPRPGLTRRRLRAWLAGFGAATTVALIGLFGSAGVALVMRWPPIRLVEAVILVPLLMLVVLSTVPTLYASWALPSPGEED